MTKKFDGEKYPPLGGGPLTFAEGKPLRDGGEYLSVSLIKQNAEGSFIPGRGG